MRYDTVVTLRMPAGRCFGSGRGVHPSHPSSIACCIWNQKLIKAWDFGVDEILDIYAYVNIYYMYSMYD